MALDVKNRWIVLINKSPKGPLTKEEIDALLEKKILRRNDIAYLLNEDGDSKAPTEWKLLWQFPQFDRRLNPIVAPPEERRSDTPIEPTLGNAETLPLELRDISVDELIPRTTHFEETPDNSPPPAQVAEAGTGFSPTPWLFAAGAVSLGGLSVWAFLAVPTSKPTPVTIENRSFSIPANRIPAVAPSATVRAPIATERREPAERPTFTPEPEVNREAERGEIAPPDEDDPENEDPGAPAKPRRKTPKAVPSRSVRSMGNPDESEEDSDEPVAADDSEFGTEPLDD